jgi:hypothetical protein
MPKSTRESRAISQIIKAHGSTLDLKSNPEVIIEIIRKWGVDLIGEVPDAGVTPGGAPEFPPPPPPGPSSIQVGPGIDDVMKEVLKLQRQVTKLTQRLNG